MNIKISTNQERKINPIFSLKKNAIESLIIKYGTPFYLYDVETIRRLYKQIKNSFSSFELAYFIKANPNPYVIKTLLDSGSNMSVTSLNELQTVLSLGCKPDKITIFGPGKTKEYIEYALKAGIAWIDIESIQQLKDLEVICKKLNRECSVRIRVNPINVIQAGAESMGGGPSRYGIDEEMVVSSIKSIHLERVSIKGIHVYVGSQILDSEAILNNFISATKMGIALSQKLDIHLEFIDLGGGLGIPYSHDDKPLDLTKLGHSVCESVNKLTTEMNCKPRFQMDIGRCLVAEAGLFFTRIIETKLSRGINYIIVDGGISSFSRPAMPWAQQHPCILLGSRNNKEKKNYVVVGPSCLPSDVLCNNANIEVAEPGDILVFQYAGAYGYTMSMVLWAGQKKAMEIINDRGKFFPSNINNGGF